MPNRPPTPKRRPVALTGNPRTLARSVFSLPRTKTTSTTSTSTTTRTKNAPETVIVLCTRTPKSLNPIPTQTRPQDRRRPAKCPLAIRNRRNVLAARSPRRTWSAPIAGWLRYGLLPSPPNKRAPPRRGASIHGLLTRFSLHAVLQPNLPPAGAESEEFAPFLLRLSLGRPRLPTGLGPRKTPARFPARKEPGALFQRGPLLSLGNHPGLRRAEFGTKRRSGLGSGPPHSLRWYVATISYFLLLLILTSPLDCDDLRHVFKTILGVPPHYTKLVRLCLGTYSPRTAWRIWILITILLTEPDAQKAAFCILHLWYSAFIPWEAEEQLNTVRQVLGRSLPPDYIPSWFTLEWDAANTAHSFVRLTMRDKHFNGLLRHMRMKPRKTARAKKDRSEHVDVPRRRDWLDMHRVRHRPGRRSCQEKFRADGILLPYGASRDAFVIQNPYVSVMSHGSWADCVHSLVWDWKRHWHLHDFASPLHGWDWNDVKTAPGARIDDLYGKLYFYLIDLISAVHTRINKEIRVDFHVNSIYKAFATGWPEPLLYDRIEVRRAMFCSLGLFVQKPRSY